VHLYFILFFNTFKMSFLLSSQGWLTTKLVPCNLVILYGGRMNRLQRSGYLRRKKLREQANGDKLTAQANGDKLTEQANGDKLTEQANGDGLKNRDKLTEQANGDGLKNRDSLKND